MFPNLENVALNMSPVKSLIYCFSLASMYVVFLYVGANNKLGRNHPDTVRLRFIRASLACLFSLLVFWACCEEHKRGHPVLMLLGFTFSSIVNTILSPLLLTLILFFGPLVQNYYNGSFSVYSDISYWQNSLKSLTWLRDHIMGPITEEIVYRACMLPVLLPCFGSLASIFLCPLFFGLAHFHHIYESIMEGNKIIWAFYRSGFQFMYTTIFGVYSAFLFIRTGSILPCIIAHMFCNHMGFPDINEVILSTGKMKTKLILSYIFGFILWCLLLYPLTCTHAVVK